MYVYIIKNNVTIIILKQYLSHLWHDPTIKYFVNFHEFSYNFGSLSKWNQKKNTRKCLKGNICWTILKKITSIKKCWHQAQRFAIYGAAIVKTGRKRKKKKRSTSRQNPRPETNKTFRTRWSLHHGTPRRRRGIRLVRRSRDWSGSPRCANAGRGHPSRSSSGQTPWFPPPPPRLPPPPPPPTPWRYHVVTVVCTRTTRVSSAVG